MRSNKSGVCKCMTNPRGGLQLCVQLEHTTWVLVKSGQEENRELYEI